MITYQDAFIQRLLIQGLGVGDLGAENYYMNLFDNDVTPNPMLDATQFNQATYTGFAGNVTFTWDGPTKDENGQWHVRKSGIIASNADSITVGPLFGYWVFGDPDAGNMPWFAERFAAPITLLPGDLLFLNPEIICPQVTGTITIVQ